jgi:hypothetical protein
MRSGPINLACYFFVGICALIFIPSLRSQADGGSSSATPAVGSDNPTGVAGIFNGNITTAGNYDPLTGNAMRIVDDLVVPGAVGAYPLKWTRYFNSRHKSSTWSYSYLGYSISGYNENVGQQSVKFDTPDGRAISINGASDAPCEGGGISLRLILKDDFHGVGVPDENGTLRSAIILEDGGMVLFAEDVDYTTFDGFPPLKSHYYYPIEIIDAYGQITHLYYNEYDWVEDGPGHRHNTYRQLHKIQEPAGRYLEISWSASAPKPRGPRQ